MSSSRRQGGRRRRDRLEAAPVRRSYSAYRDLTRRTIYVASEGGKTEFDYIDLLNTTYGAERDFALHFCRHRDNNGLRPVETVQRVLAEAGPDGPDAEKWALFDRDSGDKTPDEIRAAMRLAADKGVHVALSHPSFELWLLLHFKQHTSQENGLSDTVRKKLRSHPDADGFADYDTQSGDRGKGLTERRRQALLGSYENGEWTGIRKAVRHARQLVALCPHPSGGCSAQGAVLEPIPGPRKKAKETHEQWNERTGHAATCDPVLRDPSADVWRLLAVLGIAADGK